MKFFILLLLWLPFAFVLLISNGNDNQVSAGDHHQKTQVLDTEKDKAMVDHYKILYEKRNYDYYHENDDIDKIGNHDGNKCKYGSPGSQGYEGKSNYYDERDQYEQSKYNYVDIGGQSGYENKCAQDRYYGRDACEGRFYDENECGKGDNNDGDKQWQGGYINKGTSGGGDMGLGGYNDGGRSSQIGNNNEGKGGEDGYDRGKQGRYNDEGKGGQDGYMDGGKSEHGGYVDGGASGYAGGHHYGGGIGAQSGYNSEGRGAQGNYNDRGRDEGGYTYGDKGERGSYIDGSHQGRGYNGEGRGRYNEGDKGWKDGYVNEVKGMKGNYNHGSYRGDHENGS
ncbi:hypothetical protein ACFE04_005597 [Oxalis oulophora]